MIQVFIEPDCALDCPDPDPPPPGYEKLSCGWTCAQGKLVDFLKVLVQLQITVVSVIGCLRTQLPFCGLDMEEIIFERSHLNLLQSCVLQISHRT